MKKTKKTIDKKDYTQYNSFHIGFTGTRKGMTPEQGRSFIDFLLNSLSKHVSRLIHDEDLEGTDSIFNNFEYFKSLGNDLDQKQIEYYGVTFHHGDCFGSDEDAFHLMSLFDIPKCEIHPGPSFRSHCKNNRIENVFIHKPKPFLNRNKDIVNSSDLLIATPGEYIEELRSGTWSTIRYAEKMFRSHNKFGRSLQDVVIIYPDGKVHDRYSNNENKYIRFKDFK